MKWKRSTKKFNIFKDCKNPPEIILIKEIKRSNNKYLYKKVFKYKNNKDKKEDIYKYVISFNLKEKSVIYEVILKKGHKYLDNIAKDRVKQETMDYQDKQDLFIEALKENKKEKIKQELFQEKIELYS